MITYVSDQQNKHSLTVPFLNIRFLFWLQKQVNRRAPNCSSSSDSKILEEVASSSNKKTRFFTAVKDEPTVTDNESDGSDSESFRVKRRSFKLENRTVVLETRDSEKHQVLKIT